MKELLIEKQRLIEEIIKDKESGYVAKSKDDVYYWSSVLNQLELVNLKIQLEEVKESLAKL